MTSLATAGALRPTLLGYAALGGVVAGALDIGMAALINHVGLDVIMRAIARGVQGPAAMRGGSTSAALGFGLQLFMGGLIGAIYALGYGLTPVLTRSWVVAGLLYGVAVFAVMNYVVVPLSAVRKVPHFTPMSFTLNLAAMLVFGLIIAWAAERAVRRPG